LLLHRTEVAGETVIKKQKTGTCVPAISNGGGAEGGNTAGNDSSLVERKEEKKENSGPNKVKRGSGN